MNAQIVSPCNWIQPMEVGLQSQYHSDFDAAEFIPHRPLIGNDKKTNLSTRPELPNPSTQMPEEKKKWVEPVAALLMALATLSTAWCSFESAAWTRQSNRLMNEFNTLERKAGLLRVQGMQQATIHTGMFMQD